MAEKFNRTEMYAPFFGRITSQMPKLMASGRTPLNAAGLMDVRTEALSLADGVDDDFRATYVDNYYDLGDAVLYHPDKGIKIDLDSKALREVNPKSKLINGSSKLEDGYFESVNGPAYSLSELSRMPNGRPLSADEAKAHQVWNDLARSKDRLATFTDETFRVAKKRFGYDENMGLYLSSPEKVPTLGAFLVYRLNYRSDANDRCNLDGDNGRLVGKSVGDAKVVSNA